MQVSPSRELRGIDHATTATPSADHQRVTIHTNDVAEFPHADVVAHGEPETTCSRCVPDRRLVENVDDPAYLAAMADRLFFLTEGNARIDFVIDREDGHIMVTALFFPNADQDSVPADTSEEAAQIMEEQCAGHFPHHGSALRMIRYRDDLTIMSLADLGRFAVPVLPMAQPH